MNLAQLWRHPVKSLQGEQLSSVEVETSGFRFDRSLGIIDDETGHIMTARREPGLLFGSARVEDGGSVVLKLPGNAPDAATVTVAASSPDVDALLSAWLGHRVHLAVALDHARVTAETFSDPIDETSPLREWQLPPDRFVDSAPLLLITTQTLRQGALVHAAGRWDVRRFRPNLVVDAEGTGWLEDSWKDLHLRIGEVVISVRKPCGRCTMITRAQPGLEADREIFKSLAHEHGATFGVLCDVVAPGRISLGDEVELLG